MAGISSGATHQYDRELQPEKWPPHPDGPHVLVFHDRDISLQHDFVARTFQALPGNTKVIGMNQYVATLHAGIESAAEGFELGFQYDEPYCTYFKSHSSSWKLLLADPLSDQIKRAVSENAASLGFKTKYWE